MDDPVCLLLHLTLLDSTDVVGVVSQWFGKVTQQCMNKGRLVFFSPRTDQPDIPGSDTAATVCQKVTAA